MKTKYQCENAAMAITAVHLLDKKISKKIIKKAVKETIIKGRTEEVSKKPSVVLDVAHNPYEWETSLKEIMEIKKQKTIIIFGAMKDKDFKKIKPLLKKSANKLILKKKKTSRAADPKKIKKTIGFGEITQSVEEAVKKAFKIVKKNQTILVIGSFYIVGEALKTLKKLKKVN